MHVRVRVCMRAGGGGCMCVCVYVCVCVMQGTSYTNYYFFGDQIFKHIFL